MKRRCLTAVLLVMASAAFAHPHVYIDVSLEIEADDSGIIGLWHSWTLLRQFGWSVADQYDTDGDGSFSPDETELLEAEIFRTPDRYHYFTHIEVDGIDYFPSGAVSFSAAVSGKNPVFRFYTPCRINAGKNARSIILSVYDFSRYVSFGILNLDDPPVPGLLFDTRIERDGNIYSHSNPLGNMVFLISLIRTGEPPAGTALNTDLAGLTRLSAENAPPAETGRNPFLVHGSSIKDDSLNPFLKR